MKKGKKQLQLLLMTRKDAAKGILPVAQEGWEGLETFALEAQRVVESMSPLLLTDQLQSHLKTKIWASHLSIRELACLQGSDNS